MNYFAPTHNISPFVVPPCYGALLQNPYHGPARALPAGLSRGFLLLWTALGLLAAPASAQVDYLRDIIQPDGMFPVISAPQAPYETSRPDYSTPATPTPYFFTTRRYYSIDSGTGAIASTSNFPAAVLFDKDTSVGTFAGQNTSELLFFAVSSLGTLITYNISAGTFVSTPPIDAGIFSSLAARDRDDDLLSLIADNEHFTVNRITGELIAQPLAGVDMSVAFYQGYGQDGLLYVLDYGQSRMASFDPDNAFAPVGGFDLMTDITTANVQFGIGLNGSFYLADGLGGGSYYDAAGEFQGTFELPEDALAEAYTGASYVSTDSAGRVYVFDNATGFHQYQDASVVPEPATWSLVMGAGAILMAARRRSRASR